MFLMIQLNMIGITCTYSTAVENLMSYEAVLIHFTARTYLKYIFPISNFYKFEIFLNIFVIHACVVLQVWVKKLPAYE